MSYSVTDGLVERIHIKFDTDTENEVAIDFTVKID